MVLCQAILPRRATSITAPGTSPDSTYFWVTASMRASWLEDRPTSSGAAAMGRTGSAQLAVPKDKWLQGQRGPMRRTRE